MTTVKKEEFYCHLPTDTFVWKPAGNVWKATAIKRLLGKDALDWIRQNHGEAEMANWQFLQGFEELANRPDFEDAMSNNGDDEPDEFGL